ncbi:MAG: YeeE/YedE thiosulfate transporter family protein [Crocinitomicaceae bacterium]
MKNLKFILYGMVFSIILVKVEAVSWFRIVEMFHFQSFHMYGVMFSGIITAFIGVQFIKKYKVLELKPKPFQKYANSIGGTFFGLGWGITGACTGPLYALIGLNLWPALIVLFGAFLGTFIFAATKNRLPF